MGPEKIVALMAGIGGTDIQRIIDKTVDDQLFPQPTPDLPEDMGTDLRTGRLPDHGVSALRNYPDHQVTIYRSENNRPIGAIAKAIPQGADFSRSDIQHQAAKNLYASRRAEEAPKNFRQLSRRELRAAARQAVKQIARSQKREAKVETDQPGN